MSQQPLESRLEGLKEERLPELPEVVHTRMEKTYRMIVERDEASLEGGLQTRTSPNTGANVAVCPG